MKTADAQVSTAGGVYIHWPFCARKCPYCDFYTFGAEHPQFSKSDIYLRALLNEIASTPVRFGLASPPEIDTIYLGGGTPSLLKPEEFERILVAVQSVFRIAPGAEITLEVNPTAAESARLAPARALGVNRLSVGCQSFDDKFLKILGRDHDAEMARKTLRLIREIGYENISLDLMFGLPGQVLADLEADLEEALAFAPEHLSAYGLTLHEGTPFKRWHEEGKWTLPGHEVEAAQFELLMDRLEEAGYIQYEISNWSRNGRVSRHNSKYWSAADVYALGVSAHGVIDGTRYANPRDLEKYLGGETGYAGNPQSAVASARSRIGEIMMLASRRVDGVAWGEINGWIQSWIGEPLDFDARSFYRSELRRMTEDGLLVDSKNQLRLTRRGILLADEVAQTFF